MSHSSLSPDSRPDLEESINVPEAHGALKGDPAAARENSLRENGMEAVSLALVIVSAIVVLIGGAVMGQGGNFFGYGELTKDGYLRAKSPVQLPKVVVPEPALAFLIKEGGKVYSACASCHMDNGLGQTGQIPPLAGSEWVLGSTEKLAMIIHNGITGTIEVAGITYTNKQMNAVGKDLSAKELAALMTYIRNSWGNEASLVTPEMAANALAISAKRGGGQVTAEELKKSHDKMLPGDTLDPATLFDPETWEPVASEE